MDFLKNMIYKEASLMMMMMVMAIWTVPKGHAVGLDTVWYDARATFYGDVKGGGTQQGACGYGDLNKQGYGLATTALSTALFNDGYACGACFEIMCVNDPKWCLPGSIKVTATNFCPPDYTKTVDIWCNPPQRHFDLSEPMFLKIAQYKAGVVPVKYRRIPCVKTGGVRFEITGNPNFLTVLPFNVAGAGDVKYMQVKGSKTNWITMKKDWGQHWTTGVVLVGESLSFRVTTSDGKTIDFLDVAPSNWGFGQNFDGKWNF
ncbi:PREDICTED: expansin-A23-like [Tarenaya hassleriana]|uniref:expansin-A23-like n=1 Tax=Tarenaya hassleriana TaxID=28532 RepID=UPI00053C74DF|nr:PREDICTED: expansin-A23-like [Tarenaya hassleriana]